MTILVRIRQNCAIRFPHQSTLVSCSLKTARTRFCFSSNNQALLQSAREQANERAMITLKHIEVEMREAIIQKTNIALDEKVCELL